ncbi:MAG: hypothetical protein V1779_09270 [bacterium]
MVVNYDEFVITNAHEFVLKFNLEKEFIEHFNKTIEQWTEDIDISDSEIIEILLTKLPDKYLIKYIDQNTGYFFIYKILN